MLIHGQNCIAVIEIVIIFLFCNQVYKLETMSYFRCGYINHCLFSERKHTVVLKLAGFKLSLLLNS